VDKETCCRSKIVKNDDREHLHDMSVRGESPSSKGTSWSKSQRGSSDDSRHKLGGKYREISLGEEEHSK